MNYPNLTAEYEASGYHIATLCDHAQTTEKLMRAALYGNERLLLKELVALRRLFSTFRCIELAYLTAPAVSFISKKTRRHRAFELDELIKQVQNEIVSPNFYYKNALRQAIRCLHSLTSGNPVRWADYHNNIDALQLSLDIKREREKKRDIA